MEYKDILYIVNEPYKTVVYYRKGSEEIYSIRLFIRDVFKAYLKDLNSYKKTIKDFLNIRTKHPLYLSKELLLWRIDGMLKTYYINYFSVQKYEYKEDKLAIIFDCKKTLKIEMEKRNFLRDHDKLNKVLNYIKNSAV